VPASKLILLEQSRFLGVDSKLYREEELEEPKTHAIVPKDNVLAGKGVPDYAIDLVKLIVPAAAKVGKFTVKVTWEATKFVLGDWTIYVLTGSVGVFTLAIFGG